MRTILLCVLTVSITLVGVICYRVLRADAAAPSRSDVSGVGRAREAQELSDMRDELNALRAQMGGLAFAQQADRQAAKKPHSEAPAAMSDPTRSDSPDPDEVARVVAEEEKKRAERYARLESRVNSEPRDPSWAKAGETEMANTVAELRNTGFSGARLESTRCGSTICSAVVGYDSEQERDNAARQFRPAGFRRGTVHMYQENGQYKSVAYFVREGQEL